MVIFRKCGGSGLIPISLRYPSSSLAARLKSVAQGQPGRKLLRKDAVKEKVGSGRVFISLGRDRRLHMILKLDVEFWPKKCDFTGRNYFSQIL